MKEINVAKKEIYTTRGDDLDFDFRLKTDDGYYQFKVGDVLRLGIYKANGMDKPAMLLKDFKIDKESTLYHFHIDSKEMKIGKLINRPTNYWYEIILNGNKTVIGYNKKDPAIITLLPEGSDITKNSGGEE